MSVAVMKGSLSEPRKRLIEVMAAIRFGQIEELVVRDGDPVFDPAPRVVCHVKFGGENGPREEMSLRDYVLRAEAVELFKCFDRLGNAVVETLVVRHGLPVSLDVERMVSPS